MIEVQLNQIRNKKEEATEAGSETAGFQREVANVGNRFYGGSGVLGPFFIQTSWQGGESFLVEDLAHSGGAQAETAILEDFADLIHRMVFLSQLNYLLPCGGLSGPGRGSSSRRGKEAWIGIPAEMMAKDSESLWRVSELRSHHIGGFVFDEVCPQGLVLPLLGVSRFEEKAPALC